MPTNGKLRRAITLGGGGPAAGLHIGVLEALANADPPITFNVWSLSCIGAWVGIVYNQSDKKSDKDKVEETYEFFRDGVFRDDQGYKHFPINRVFGPDWRNNINAFNKFVRSPENYSVFQWQPFDAFDCIQESLSILIDHMPHDEKPARKLDEGDFNRWILNQVMAPNPFIRYLTSMMYLSGVDGLSKINYPHSDFMKKINFRALSGPEKPFIFHNAWDLDRQELAFFANREMRGANKPDQAKRYQGLISAESLCACSALPFVEETVKIGRTTYCEGALVDTVNFQGLLELQKQLGYKLDEIWISRIVDHKQIRKPKNLHDALANLCQLFAASVGEDDVKLFKYHIRYDNRDCDENKDPKAELWNGTVVEIHVPGHINFKWNHSNLENGRKLGRAAAEQAINAYHVAEENEKKGKPHRGKPRFINESPKGEEWQRVLNEYGRLKEEADRD
jgi:predicted acylesterase/phospholipase RssA